MTTPKCPLCGTPLKAIRGYDVHGITTDWVAGCYNCFFQSSHFWKTKKACIEDMDRLVSLFPPIMRVWPGDKLKLDFNDDILTVIGKNTKRCKIYLEDCKGNTEIATPDDVDQWPWELDQKGGQQ